MLEHLHLNLRCYSCDGDLWLRDVPEGTYVSPYFCNDLCSRTSALSDEIVFTFKLFIQSWTAAVYLEWVGALAVADAMLEPHHMRGSGRPGKSIAREQPDGLRSYQWRTIRIQQLESLIPA